MRRVPVVVATCLIAGAALTGTASADRPGSDHTPASAQNTSGSQTGAYVVLLREGSDPRGVARAVGARSDHVYTRAVTGFAATLNAGQLNALRRHPATRTVELDGPVTADATQHVSKGLWGLDRIDQAKLPLSGTYTYTSTGQGVTAYVIDSGIDVSHPDFQGRAQVAFDALGGDGLDCDNHGTHVAGTIGGKTHGIAKQVQLRAVRVLNCNGSGKRSQLLAGIEWVRANAVSPAVANISVGGSYSTTVNEAVHNLIAAGIVTSVSAGNDAIDACDRSPASAPAVLTTAASDQTDTHASFSNFGPCVDLYAPGRRILSTDLAGGTRTATGTSMAAPHVAGVAALYLSAYPTASAGTVADWVTTTARQGTVAGSPAGTSTRLLQTGGM